MKATYLSKDNNWANGTTTYWFDVNYNDSDNVEMGVVESGCDESVIVDNESRPIYEGETSDYTYFADLVDCVTEEMRAE